MVGYGHSTWRLTGTYPSNVIVTGLCAVNAGRAVVDGNLAIAQAGALLAAFALNNKTQKGFSDLTVRTNAVVGRGRPWSLAASPALPVRGRHGQAAHAPVAGTSHHHTAVGGYPRPAPAIAPAGNPPCRFVCHNKKIPEWALMRAHSWGGL
jgi:hypothetical protein